MSSTKAAPSGVAPADNNEADAILGWHHVCTELDPEAALTATPLFSQ